MNDSIQLPNRPISLHELVKRLRRLHAGGAVGPGLRLTEDEERWVAQIILKVADSMPGLAPYIYLASPGCVRIEWDVVGWDVWAAVDATDESAHIHAVRDSDGLSQGAVAHGEMHHVAEAIVDIMRRIEARGDVEVVPRGN